MPPLPPRSRARRRRRAASAAGAASLALLASSPAQASYLGPTYCITPSASAAGVVQSHVRGYSTFNHLLFDMVSLASTFKSGRIVPEERLTFRICPGTVIDLDDSSLPLGYLPIEVPRLTLQCGEHGKRGTDPNGSDKCIVRGGGKRNPKFRTWNTNPQRAYKNSAAGIIGGGEGSVAQIYVYGESAYEITLKGLTFDNAPSRQEAQLYEEYVAQFGENFKNDDAYYTGGQIEEEYEESVPSSSSSGNESWGEGNRLQENRNDVRNLQSGNVQPAHRFASVAVRGKGYGDDAGPRLLTIENCRFERHRGYAVLVSPGILQPDMPGAPEYNEFKSVNLQSSGSIYGHGGSEGSQSAEEAQSYNDRKRRLNLLDNGDAYIPEGGPIRYYDDAAGRNYLDGRRVNIRNTEFVDNVVSGDRVAGLVTSAYSLTLTGCAFRNNDAKAMVFVYNTDALIDNSIFAKNAVEVSTIVMASPKDAKESTANSSFGERITPTHIVERSCFLSSRVGMSNVLVTDVDAAGFGQRDNHASGTEFTWVSTCEGAAAEVAGHDCLENGNCDGTCVAFDAEKCGADGVNEREFQMMWNGGGRSSVLTLGATLGLALALGAGVFV